MKQVGVFGGKFLPLHAGHVYAITKAACQVKELYIILTYSKNKDERLCREGVLPVIPHSVRLQWLRTLTKDMENVRVLAVEGFEESDKEYDWIAGGYDIRAAIGKEIDCIFSSEAEYGPIFDYLYPEAEHILIDEKRVQYPISGTKIREEGVYKHWDMIPEVVKPFFVKKVALVGTESCGKTTVARYLSQIHQTVYVEEYGRLICEELGGSDDIMTEDHFKELAYSHKYFEYQQLKKANKFLFIDSEAVVSQYYSKLYFGHEFDWLEGVVDSQEYDLYLFLEPDIPWVNDGMRSHGDVEVRMANNEMLKQMFRERDIPFVTIGGSYADRFNQANEEVLKLLSPKKELVCC